MWRNRIEQTVIGLCVKPSEARADVGKAWAEAVRGREQHGHQVAVGAGVRPGQG
jgi:hypothetical protein